VVSQTLAARPAFTDWKPLKTSQLAIDVRETLTLASFAAFKGKKDQVKAAIRERYGVELPDTPQRVEGKDIAFIWAGPDQWIAMAERGQNRDIEVELKPLLDGLSSVVDQSDARAVVRISGPRARDVLAKGVPIDLHPRAFEANNVAITHASHIGIIFWQIDDVPAYDIAMFRSFADSFAHWLIESSAEFVA
jgi:heterotetrameric sarcosine oxidase gamma subunit